MTRPFLAPGATPPIEPPRFPGKPAPGRPPRRRGLLAAVTALAVAPGVALSAAPVSPDAALIQDCARYLEIERIMADPHSAERHLDCDRMTVWPEYEALERTIYEAAPRTAEGWTALASVALLCDGAIESDTWDDREEMRLAWKVLAHLAGPAVVQEERRCAADRRRRSEAVKRRISEDAAAQPAAEPRRDTLTPQQKIDGARRMIEAWQGILAEAEAELAAA